MQISSIEIHAGHPGRPYRAISEITAKVSAGSIFMNAPAIEEANLKLKEAASAIYANAVIDVV